MWVRSISLSQSILAAVNGSPYSVSKMLCAWCAIVAFNSLQYVASQKNQALVQPQVNTWNSSFKLSAAQIKAANLTAATAHNIEVAIRYERTNNAGGLVQDDPFYEVPASFDYANPPPPGTILRVEQHTNTSLYTIPPSLSMSRIMYTSESLNGTSIPATGYILWPYLPKQYPRLESCSGKTSSSVYPVIAYAHGSSGQTPACAVSHLRNLWDSWHEPFAMALAGYAVVVSDYAGLGVSTVPSPYFVMPAQANDLYHAVTAAQSTFPDILSEEFVVMGQSQGGGVAWAGAQRQHARPKAGYLGTVAASPFTNILADIAADAAPENNGRVAGIAQGLNSVLPSFQLSDWLTKTGIARVELMHAISGCSTTADYMFSGADGNAILNPKWNLTSAAEWYSNVTTNGGKPFAGPMLVIQGDIDPNANAAVTAASVRLQCELYPESQLNYYEFEGVAHVPVLYAGQHIWQKWIEDRFNRVTVPQGCDQHVVAPVRGIENIDKNVNWFMEINLFDYE